MPTPFTFYENKEEEIIPLSPLSQAFQESPVFTQDEDNVKLDLAESEREIHQTKPGTYIVGLSRFGKRPREDLGGEKDPMGPPKLQRQHAVHIMEESKEESFNKVELDEDNYIPMPGNKDYDKKPSYHRKNISPFGNYIFNYEFVRNAPPVGVSKNTMNEYRIQMMNDMENLRRLIYDYETHIDFNGCREERLKSYRVLDQLLHFNQLEKLYQPTGDEICMNPSPSSDVNECFHSSPFETSPNKCDNILHDHNSK